jgi:acylglycerol lipase
MDPITDSMNSADGLKLHTVSWIPYGTPKAVVLLIHGVAEHAGRYQHVADFLTGHGYAIYSMDYIGHGHSEGTRAFLHTLDQPVSDLEIYLDRIHASHPETPVFVYGHSMGSLIGLLLCLRRQGELAGMISSATPLCADEVASPIMVFGGQIISKILPHLYLVPLDASALSRDEAVVRAYRDDPLVFNQPVRARTANAIVEASRRLRQQIIHLRLPLLIVHGSADSISPADGSEFLYRLAGSPDKTLRIYPDQFHELHNEPEKAVLFDELLAWLDSH